MKAELYTNCSLVRIPIKAGVTEYHFPMNVDWANRKIDKIVFLHAPNCLDPIDGVSKLFFDETNMYVDLFSTENREIMHHVQVNSLTQYHHPALKIGCKLDLQLCRLFFTDAPTADGTLLGYVFYGTREEEYYDRPKKGVTCTFPLTANEQKSFQEIINDYVRALPATVQGITAWIRQGDQSAAYITLRDKALTYQMDYIHTEMIRPAMYGNFSPPRWWSMNTQPFLLNDLDIDFDNSFIREARGVNSTFTITFFYS